MSSSRNKYQSDGEEEEENEKQPEFQCIQMLNISPNQKERCIVLNNALTPKLEQTKVVNQPVTFGIAFGFKNS